MSRDPLGISLHRDGRPHALVRLMAGRASFTVDDAHTALLKSGHSVALLNLMSTLSRASRGSAGPFERLGKGRYRVRAAVTGLAESASNLSTAATDAPATTPARPPSRVAEPSDPVAVVEVVQEASR